MRYNRVVGNGKMRMRCCSGRGFRLHMKRLTVSRLGARFMCFFRLLSKWRWSSLSLSLSLNKKKKKRSNNSHSKTSHSSSSEDLHNHINYSYNYRKHQGLGRSNSFYAEAIADCLEFIKRSSISVDSSS